MKWGWAEMIDCGESSPAAALLYLEAAIRIMDSCGAPFDAAAHADLAKARLEDWMASPGMGAVASRPIESGFRERAAER